MSRSLCYNLLVDDTSGRRLQVPKRCLYVLGPETLMFSICFSCVFLNTHLVQLKGKCFVVILAVVFTDQNGETLIKVSVKFLLVEDLAKVNSISFHKHF